jgi:hypothetical protein
MPTLLKKDVTRETYSVTDRRGQKVIVTLKAGDMISFRVKGKRTRYEVPLQSVFYLSLIQYLHDQHKEKVKRWKERKSIGQRARKPSRPPRIYSKKFYDALKL